MSGIIGDEREQKKRQSSRERERERESVRYERMEKTFS